MSEQESFKKSEERAAIDLFLVEYRLITGREIGSCMASERPDFLCLLDGEDIGLEIVRVMADPDSRMWRRILDRDEFMPPLDTLLRLQEAVYKKEEKRLSRSWQRHMPGTLVLWPGVAEELMSGKAWLVRDGVFKNVDVTLFTHVGDRLAVSYGQSSSNALISAIFKFKGSSAHAAGAPWRGKSALDAVMLMANGWEFHREHMELAQRSHYVIVDGGDQPNVVPSTASIWFYFRERDYDRTRKMFDDAKKMAEGATLMTGTQIDTIMMVGSGWSGHFSRPIAELMYRNIEKVGTPTWSEGDQALARGIQRELGVPDSGLTTKPGRLSAGVPEALRTGGGSDDIGDVSWTVPTITLNYPSNIPNLPGHNWANAISMATPIAHKGVVAGAKVQAMTMLDILMQPQVVADAWRYFNDVQTKTVKYHPFFAPTDKPPIWLNEQIMAKYRPEMRKYYYDPKKYATYLEQLGITYPTVRKVVQ
jgi:aminobenzoyl-glutamate utilization protein B